MKLIVRFYQIAACLLMVAECQAIDVSGETSAGAFYRFILADTWNSGDLLIYNHGFDTKELAPLSDADMGPLLDIQLSQGFAVAASSYSSSGWALFHVEKDIRQLIAEFTSRFGAPSRIWVYGGSMGGLVTSLIAEMNDLPVVAAYSLCGAIGGSRVWDRALDLRLAYDAVCQGVTGAEIPGGAEGFPFSVPPEVVGSEIGQGLALLLGAAVNVCTGVSFPSFLRTNQQQARLNQLINNLQVSEDFLLINMAYSTVVLGDLIHNADKLNGIQGVGNAHVVYPENNLDQSIQRIEADPAARMALFDHYTPSGQVASTKILALNTNQDGLVEIEHLGSYIEALPAQQLSWGIVAEDEASHCGFTQAEVVAGWQQLRHWVEEGNKPDALSIQNACLALEQDTEFEGPCRIDPQIVPDNLQQKLLTRNSPAFPIDSRITGSWRNLQRSGEGWIIQVFDDDKALVVWFTYPNAADSEGQQVWMLGVGQIENNEINIEQLDQTSGARFGQAFNSADVNFSNWGSIRFEFQDCQQGALSYIDAQGNARAQKITRLTEVSGAPCDDVIQSSRNISGSWYDPLRSGEGMLIEELAGDLALIYWFTYTPDGQQAWVYGVAPIENEAVSMDQLYQTSGTFFGDDFQSEDVINSLWGSGQLVFDDCASMSLSFDAIDERYGTGQLQLQKLTGVVGQTCDVQ